MNHTLTTPKLQLILDERGRLLSLKNLVTGTDYAGGKPVWRLYYEEGQRFQELIRQDEQKPQVTATDAGIEFGYPELSHKQRTLPIRLRFGVRIVEDEAHWWCELDNQTEEIVLKEIHFPLIGAAQLLPDQELITTFFGGLRYRSPVSYIQSQYPPNHHWYGNADHEGKQVQLMYPGCSAASNCYVLPAPREGLYAGSHDDTFRNTLHLFRLENDQDFECGFVKHLFTRPTESLRIDGYVLSPYSGTWHVAADKYRAWCSTWFHRVEKPQWMKNFRGWQRLILKHQNGDILFPYDSFPQIFKEGKKAGIDALFMFGWWPGGMDRFYPEYVADPELGGEASLRENIRIFQEELGGTVIFYASGRLVDRNSEFYKRIGSKLAIKTRSGAEARDAYLFSNSATYERLYGAVELTPMCLDCPEWVKVLETIIDQAAEFGCKAVFFDQLGLHEYPCYDKDHGHPVPYVTQTEGKRRVISHLRDYCKSKYPELGFGVEVFTDAVGQYFDFIHGLYHQNYIARNPDYQERGVKPEYAGFIEWMRYVYPDVPISDRDIRDDTDLERRVNYSLLVGLLHDVEIYRCRKTIDEIPRYQQWLGQVNDLRARHEEILSQGTYRDVLGFSNSNPDVEGRCFRLENRMAIVLTQSHLDRVETLVACPGWSIQTSDGMGDYDVQVNGKAATVQLGRHAIAIIICTSENEA